MDNTARNWGLLAPLLVAIAGICWGAISLFTQTLAGMGLASPQITAARCFFTALIFGLVLLVFDRKAFRIKLKDLWMVAGSGVLSIAFFNVCYFTCMQECSVSIACVLLYTAPCFVTVMARIFFNEAMTRRKLACLLVAFFGCAMVVGVGSGQDGMTPFGIAVGLGSGLGYALYSIFGTVALKKYPPTTFTFYTFVFAALVMIPLSGPGQIVELAATNGFSLVVMVGLAALCTVVPFACYTLGLKHMEASKASIIAFIEPMVALLIGSFVFHDVLTPQNILGVICILGAVLVLNLPEKKTP